MSELSPTTHFSFEIQYPEHAAGSRSERAGLMESLGPTIKQLLAAQDGAAMVAVSDSHKGDDHKLVELTTVLDESQVRQLLQSFVVQHGLHVLALE